MASRGDAATFDPYAVDPARQFRQRKVFRIYAAPNARRPKRRATSGAKGLGRRTIGRGWPLPRSKDNAKSFWHQMGYLRAVLLCAKSRTAPWCAKVTSSHRRSLHAARPIHERSETALCAARAPPRRRVGSRARETRFCKNYAFAPNGVGGRRE